MIDASNVSYTVNGIELTEISQAYPTSRCLPYNPNGNLFEMQAEAEDKDGNLYYVTWLFEDNGEESYDDYDYSQPNDCTLIECASKPILHGVHQQFY